MNEVRDLSYMFILKKNRYLEVVGKKFLTSGQIREKFIPFLVTPD